MTKDKALYRFFNTVIPVTLEDLNIEKEEFDALSEDDQDEILNGGFMRFYPSTSVPEDAIFPYGTYELITSAFEAGEVVLTVNLWFYTTSEAIPNAKAEEMGKRIDEMAPIRCDGGAIWLKRGSPWCQSLSDETDKTIKRRYINITAEYLTSH